MASTPSESGASGAAAAAAATAAAAAAAAGLPTTTDPIDLQGLRDKYADLPAPRVRLGRAVTCKDAGKACFLRKDYEAAAAQFQFAVDAVENEWDFTASDAREAKQLRVLCHSNRAQCLLHLKRPFEAKKCCDAALEIDDEHAKTLYRRGVAQSRLGAFESARKDFRRALALEPDNKFVKKEMDKLAKRVEAHKVKEKRIFEKAFRQMDGVFSNGREEEAAAARGGLLEQWFSRAERLTLTYAPWAGTCLPLAVLAAQAAGWTGSVTAGAAGASNRPSRLVCSCLFFVMGWLQFRWAQRGSWMSALWALPVWLHAAVRWGSAGLSSLLALALAASRSRVELALVARVAIAYVAVVSAAAVAGEERGARNNLRERGLRAASVVLLLALLRGHA